jgi:hypothetical protein
MDVTAVRRSKLWLFTRPELLVSMAFLNPGNLEGDLLAGATIGHPLVLRATAMGLLVQLPAGQEQQFGRNEPTQDGRGGTQRLL